MKIQGLFIGIDPAAGKDAAVFAILNRHTGGLIAIHAPKPQSIREKILVEAQAKREAYQKRVADRMWKGAAEHKYNSLRAIAIWANRNQIRFRYLKSYESEHQFYV